MSVVVLSSNRPPHRFYRGGRRITEFRGEPPAAEREPEDWVASVTTVAGEQRLGLSSLPDGRLLAEAVAADPAGWLGEAHDERWGADPLLLVKLLDAGQRLPVHAHPDGDFAHRHLDRAHGKSEAWYILRGGDVHLGLIRQVGVIELFGLLEQRDADRMLGLLHRVTVVPGDVVYVPPGVLHAIGEGVLLVELQEPEDLSILLEWAGFDIDGPRDGHLGLGYPVALQAVERRGRGAEEIAPARAAGGSGRVGTARRGRRVFPAGARRGRRRRGARAGLRRAGGDREGAHTRDRVRRARPAARHDRRGSALGGAAAVLGARRGARVSPARGIRLSRRRSSPTSGNADEPVNIRSMAERASEKPRLLSGGNPQIPKGDGDEPVQAYLAAMPGWKRDVGRVLDDLILRTVPDVRKAVRWNSPFYGIEGNGWFLSFHCFTEYVKVTWHHGSSLDPLPPGESKHEHVRYLDIHEDEELDEELIASWIRQAAELPGEDLF